MRLSILSKILLLVMALSVIPVLFGSITSYRYFTKLETLAKKQLEETAVFSTEASKDSLDALGRQIIKNRALGTAILVDLYLKEHPNKTLKNLVEDADFQKLGVLPVGEKGYTVVVTADDSTFIAHPNQKLLNISPYDMEALKGETFANFWEILNVVTKEQKESEGYYSWVEPDGSISQKYMYVALTDGKTKDGRRLATAATTYINEFNTPAEKLSGELSAKYEEVVKEIDTLKQNIVLTRIFVVSMLVILVTILSVFFSKRITDPIRRLTEGAKAVTSDNVDSPLPEIKTGDEIEELATSLETMRKNITNQTRELIELKRSLEKKVEERTKELQEAQKAVESKLNETEHINKTMIDRELKMVELKKELEELKKKQA